MADSAPVTLIVKAANQQFEDQTIRCEISWTIERLKSYLSEVYPNKPVSRPRIVCANSKRAQSIRDICVCSRSSQHPPPPPAMKQSRVLR